MATDEAAFVAQSTSTQTASERTVALVIPFLNEEAVLPELYRRVSEVFKTRSERLLLLFVDDGSSDGSEDIVRRLQASDSRVGLLQLSRNFGHQAAITAGLDYCDADAVIVMDADLQDPPEVIPDLLHSWYQGAEVVYAVRRRRRGEPWMKRALAAAFYRIFRAMSRIDVPLDAGDFRLMDRRVVEALRQVRESHRYLRGLTSWVGFRQDAVQYVRAPRHAGVAKYRVWSSASLALDAITSFSAIPLRWMGTAGVALCLFGLSWLVVIVLGKLLHPEGPVQGWPAVMAAVLSLGGLQLISLALLGQYLSRTLEEAKRRPLYVIRDTALPAMVDGGGATD